MLDIFLPIDAVGIIALSAIIVPFLTIIVIFNLNI